MHPPYLPSSSIVGHPKPAASNSSNGTTARRSTTNNYKRLALLLRRLLFAVVLVATARWRHLAAVAPVLWRKTRAADLSPIVWERDRPTSASPRQEQVVPAEGRPPEKRTPIVESSQGPRHAEMSATKSSTLTDQHVGSEAQSSPAPQRRQHDAVKTVRRVFWLHIQKTGTSLFNTLCLHFCPRILDEHPEILVEWKKLSDTRLTKEFPLAEWCEVPFENSGGGDIKGLGIGRHYPYRKKYDATSTTAFTMLRDPRERLRSAFAFRPIGGVPLHSRLKNPKVTIETYVKEPQIQNCQLKMVLGKRCNQVIAPERLNVTRALVRITSPNFFFGITDRWNESICLFHKWYGGHTREYELQNNRPTRGRRRKGEGAEGNVVTIQDYADLDTVFIAEAMNIFDARLREAGCLQHVEGGGDS